MQLVGLPLLPRADGAVISFTAFMRPEQCVFVTTALEAALLVAHPQLRVHLEAMPAATAERLRVSTSQLQNSSTNSIDKEISRSFRPPKQRLR
jgi:hypothetical protein